jgi:hypothetical protein
MLSKYIENNGNYQELKLNYPKPSPYDRYEGLSTFLKQLIFLELLENPFYRSLSSTE